MATAMSALTSGILALVERMIPAPQIRVGVVERLYPIGMDGGYGVLVRMPTADDLVPCGWSAAFGLELEAVGADALTGATVHVVTVDSQPVVAYSFTSSVRSTSAATQGV